MTKNKKLGLLLCPLLPLTAIGIVEVAGALASMTAPPPIAVREVREVAPPVVRYEAPPRPALPEPEPAPVPTMPRGITAD